jgi:hypothetical protein
VNGMSVCAHLEASVTIAAVVREVGVDVLLNMSQIKVSRRSIHNTTPRLQQRLPSWRIWSARRRVLPPSHSCRAARRATNRSRSVRATIPELSCSIRKASEVVRIPLYYRVATRYIPALEVRGKQLFRHEFLNQGLPASSLNTRREQQLWEVAFGIQEIRIRPQYTNWAAGNCGCRPTP